MIGPAVDAGAGVPRRLISGTTGGWDIRGAPKSRPLAELRSEDPGRPGDLPQATLEDRSAGETRNQIAGNIGGANFGETRRTASRWS